MKIACSLTVILLFPLLVNAYTWRFTSPPRQCGNVTLSIQDSGGQPPYSLLILPTGPSPLPNIEVRAILNIPFSGASTTVSFNLNYPENSSFVAVVSDQSGFGTGGASTSVTVLQSPDSSCYNPSNPTKPAWYFNFEPTGGLTQCESVRLWWEAPFVNGTVNFYGTIPGGTSFAIPQGSLSSNSATGTGFDWIVDIAAATHVLLIGNDDRIGSGGSAEVNIGYTMNGSCLNNNSPSSTPGTPPGGSYPTGTSESSSNGSGSYPASTSGSSGNSSGIYPTSTSGSSGNDSRSHSSSSNTRAIIGGVVGAAIFVLTCLVAFWFVRRRSHSAFSQQRPVNMLQDNEDENEEYQGLPQRYVSEPYLVPDQTTGGTSDNRPLSMSTVTVTSDVQRPLTPTGMTPMTMTRKSDASLRIRPVNIVQHDDAGPSEDLSGQAEPELIELPPAYSNIRRPQRSLASAFFHSNRRQG